MLEKNGLMAGFEAVFGSEIDISKHKITGLSIDLIESGISINDFKMIIETLERSRECALNSAQRSMAQSVVSKLPDGACLRDLVESMATIIELQESANTIAELFLSDVIG